MTQTPTPTQQICERIAATTFETLDRATIAKVIEAIADGVAVGIAGCRQKPVSILADYASTVGNTREASLWGRGIKASAASAALVNAAATHVLDYEPMSSPSTHAVSPVLPVAFALAEAHAIAGHEVVTACAKGFEMQHRLLYATSEAVRRERRFHWPGVVGGMGAVVAASHLLGLDAGQTAHALGIAGSRAGCLLANAGTMTKCTHAGYAASGGLEAALLAQRGFTANEDILSDPKGYLFAFLGRDSFDYSRLFAFGKPFRVVDPGMAYKFFPSKFPTQFGITAALELHRQIPDPSTIRSVAITTPVMSDVDRPQPKTGLEGKFSFQYTVAAALLDGEVRIGSFSDARRFREDMVGLLPKIRLTQSEDIPLDFRHMRVEIDVETHSGRHYKTECAAPKGFWGTVIDPEEHMKKLRDCMSEVFDEAHIQHCMSAIRRLESLSASDMTELFDLLRGRETPKP